MAPRLSGSFDGPVGPTDGQAPSCSDKSGAGTPGGPSPGRLELDLSLRAQIEPNDPDLRHEADRYIRPGQFPCSEAGLTLRGPSWPHWLRYGCDGCASGHILFRPRRLNFL